MKKDLAYYLGLPWGYSFQWVESDGGYYFAQVNGLNVFSDAQTMEEALVNIREALICHLEALIESGATIPEPLRTSDFKGRVAFRTSPEKHYRMALAAKAEGKSLNRWLEDITDRSISA